MKPVPHSTPMRDKWSKTHPWRCRLLKPYPRPDIAADYCEQPGERMARTKGDMQAFVDIARHHCGPDIVTDVWKEGRDAPN